MTDLQDFPLGVLRFHPVIDPALRKVFYKKAGKLLFLSHCFTVLQRSINIQKQGNFFFLINLHLQLQNCLYSYDPLLTVIILPHLQITLGHGNVHIRKHIRGTACALHFLIKGDRLLQPLEGICLIIPPVKRK